MKNKQFWKLLYSRLFPAAVFFFILFFIVTSPQIVKSVVENQNVLADLQESFYRLRGLYHMTAEGGEGEGESELEDARAHLREDLSFQEVLRTSLWDFLHDGSIEMDVRVGPLPETTLKDDEKNQVLSILREALSNVQKHSGAARVRVKVEWQPPF